MDLSVNGVNFKANYRNSLINKKYKGKKELLNLDKAAVAASGLMNAVFIAGGASSIVCSIWGVIVGMHITKSISDYYMFGIKELKPQYEK